METICAQWRRPVLSDLIGSSWIKGPDLTQKTEDLSSDDFRCRRRWAVEPSGNRPAATRVAVDAAGLGEKLPSKGQLIVFAAEETDIAEWRYRSSDAELDICLQLVERRAPSGVRVSKLLVDGTRDQTCAARY